MFYEFPTTRYDWRFCLAGVPVRVNPFFWAVTAALGSDSNSWLHFLAWIAAVFASIFVHELGHALCARALHHWPYVTLYTFGGVTSYHPVLDEPVYRRLGVLVCGPAAGLLLALGLFGVYSLLADSPHAFSTVLVHQTIIVSLSWSVLNLLPLWPLDVGQIPSYLADRPGWIGWSRSVHSISGLIAGLLAAAAMLYLHHIPLTLFFLYLGLLNLEGWRRKHGSSTD